jgi:transcriptional regulator with XRE-family HTH domain
LEVLTVVHRTDPDACDRRRRLGAAIRRHRRDLSQVDLAAALGVSQAGVSLWESGGVDFSYEQVRDIERVLGLPLGTLGCLAGYATPGRSMASFTVEVDSADDVAALVRTAAVLGWPIVAANRVEGLLDDESSDHGAKWVVVIGDSTIVDGF